MDTSCIQNRALLTKLPRPSTNHMACMIQVLLPPEEKTKCSLRYQSRFSYLQHNLIGSTITDECIQAMRPFLEMF